MWSLAGNNTPAVKGTRLTHHMQILPPAKGAWMLKTMYAVLRLPRQQRRCVLTSLNNIKSVAEHQPN